MRLKGTPAHHQSNLLEWGPVSHRAVLSLWGKNKQADLMVENKPKQTKPNPGGFCALATDFEEHSHPAEGACGRFLTSEHGELGVDSDLPMRVLSNALVNVLVAGRAEGLDPQDSTCTLIKLDGLGAEGGKETHTRHGGTADTATQHCKTPQQLPLGPTRHQQGQPGSAESSG